MSVDLELLRREAELLLKEWDAGLIARVTDLRRGHEEDPPARSNPGAVAERCLALIRAIDGLSADARAELEG